VPAAHFIRIQVFTYVHTIREFDGYYSYCRVQVSLVVPPNTEEAR